MINEKQKVFREILLETFEEVGLANAITEGRKSDFVSEEEVMTVLKKS